MNWNDGLSGPALNIAQSEQSPIRVIAGPGTGKTFALMRRVARLIQQDGEWPGSIFLCSFTRTASADLAKSLKDLGISGVDEIKATTLHAYCFSVLEKEDVLSLTGRVPRPMLEMEVRFLVEDLKCASFGGVRDCKKRLLAFAAAWARLQHEEPGWCSDPVDKQFELALYAWLRFHQAMLIGELVPEALKFFRNNPANSCRGHFRHVLVDEFQDLNKAEQEFLGLLAEEAKYSVIGDDNQSIYSFKHAHPEGILEFSQKYTGTYQQELNECRRCPTRIVAMANSLIAHNTVRSNRLLTPKDSNPGGEIYLVQWISMNDEARGVARFVREKIARGDASPGEVLVLAPRRQFGYAIRDELKAENIAAHSFFSEEIFGGDITKNDASPSVESYLLLSLLANPDDRVALRSWCGTGHASLRKDVWAALRAHCEQSGLSPRQTMDAMLDGNLILTADTTAVKGLLKRYKKLKDRLAELDGVQGKALFHMLFPGDASWAEGLQTLSEQIDDNGLVGKVLDVVATHISQPELPTDVDYVRVMSLHKSKGLTAKVVIVTGCVEGIMPFIEKGLPEAEHLRKCEEQRRLIYVAITRTTQTLLLSSVITLPIKLAMSMGVETSSKSGPNAVTITTRFWSEFGPSCPNPIRGTELL
jgi:DNA helicase II / ATP-dependent DNA helicase PcrA